MEHTFRAVTMGLLAALALTLGTGCEKRKAAISDVRLTPAPEPFSEQRSIELTKTGAIVTLSLTKKFGDAANLLVTDKEHSRGFVLQFIDLGVPNELHGTVRAQTVHEKTEFRLGQFTFYGLQPGTLQDFATDTTETIEKMLAAGSTPTELKIEMTYEGVVPSEEQRKQIRLNFRASRNSSDLGL